MKNNCPMCHKPANVIRSTVVRNDIVQGCDNCLPEHLQQGHDGAAKYNREWQKTEYRKDLLQPGDPAFIKEYPKEAGEMYSEDTMRRFS